ncbi:hypothetical protein GCM10010121_085700 [Streptomyces brasiliensis]|uniref:Uncharacterized protein n=1 Tax=Streptomyces brasiliensis TaxID=1954 RepID=A0A917UJ85_9ACTN|nr:hypothetical protein GCM10010121_085700 [Streptomyces brasiliensis]
MAQSTESEGDRRVGGGDNHPEGPGGAAQVAVTDTGNATAASQATAVTGYRGPAPEINIAPAVSFPRCARGADQQVRVG